MKKWLIISCTLWSVVAMAQDPILIISRNTGMKTLADGNIVRTFGFAEEIGQNPPVPGPTIEINEGDSVIIDFWNISQGAPHTIHLHGLDVNQENDGVPHLSFEVHHMEHGFYRFRAPHAGTYLYHCHVVSSIHVQAGMYGLLVVKPPEGSNYTWDGGYEIHSEARLLMSEIDTNWHTDSVLLHEYDTTMSHHIIPIPVYDPQHFLVNGRSEQQLIDKVEITGYANYNTYVRLANVGYLANRVIFPPELNARIIDSDGRPLPTEESTDTVEVYPGERYGVLCNPTALFSGSVRVQYVNLNTDVVENEQEIAVDIDVIWGIEDQGSTSITVFPNPAVSEIVVNDPAGELQNGGQMQLTSLSGAMIRQWVLPEHSAQPHRLSVADLPSGVYLLTISGSGSTHRQRLVKI